MIKSCYIRVDANSNIGIGHLARTEILADELDTIGLKISFICKTIPIEYVNKLEAKDYKVFKSKESDKELDLITKLIPFESNTLLITDSDIEELYSARFQKGVRLLGIKLMMITFYHKHHFYADIILNQNIMALSQEYSCEKYTKKFLGPKNVILKSEYRLISKNLDFYKKNRTNKTILLTFGGVDGPDRTSFVFEALQKVGIKPDKIIIVLGSLYKNKESLKQIVDNSDIETEIYQNTTKMPYLLAEADIVFNSGGLTVWESGALKSFVVIIGHSQREQQGGKYLGDNKLGIYLGTKNDYTTDSLSVKIDTIFDDYQNMVNNLYSKIDANGIQNVIVGIRSL